MTFGLKKDSGEAYAKQPTMWWSQKSTWVPCHIYFFKVDVLFSFYLFKDKGELNICI